MAQKHNYSSTSNEKLNVPMTEKQWMVVDFVAFESETSVIYPFQIGFDDMTMEMVESICLACKGCVYDTEVLYEACESILGTNSILKEAIK